MMQKTLFILLAIFSICTKSYSQEEPEKNYITKIISDFKKQEKISENPVIVINETIIDNKKIDSLKLTKDDIISLRIFEKGQNSLIEIYGKNSQNGIIFIERKPLNKE